MAPSANNHAKPEMSSFCAMRDLLSNVPLEAMTWASWLAPALCSTMMRMDERVAKRRRSLESHQRLRRQLDPEREVSEN